MQTLALILFLITYVLMIALSDKRPYVALASAVISVSGRAVPMVGMTLSPWRLMVISGASV